MGIIGLLVGAVLIISGCGGGGGGGSDPIGGITPTPPNPPTPAPSTLSGTAAAGAPIQGTVNLRDSAGTVRTQTINANGEFQFDLAGLTGPYLLWADGMANAKEGFFYSMATEGGRVNVTPATHCIMAMALGQNPVSYYRANPNAAPPDAAKVDAARQKLAALLAKLFETMGVPAGFCPMTGQFTCDGTKFDGIMDIVDMVSDDEFVSIIDRGSNIVLYKQELATGNVVAEETPDKINELCMASLTVLNEIKSILKKFSDQFATARPTYGQLLPVLQPLMSDEFRHDGNDREGLILNLATNGAIGQKFENIALYRKMKSHSYGTAAPWSIDELPAGYAEGVWCTYTFRTNRAQPRINAFVRETVGGPWKMHGNQNPFQSGGKVEAQSAWWKRNLNFNGLQILSGLRFRSYDYGDSALNRFGIDKFIVLNGALPDWTASSGNQYKAVFLSRDPSSVGYNITSTGSTWQGRYFERDGLDVDAVANREFLFVGFNSANQPTHAWISLLNKKPIKEAELWKDVLDRGATGEFSSYFSELLSIWGQPSEVYMPPGSISSLSIPLEWELAPDGRYLEWVGVSWRYDPALGNYTKEVSNPALGDISLDPASWISTTLDITGANWPPIFGNTGSAYSYLFTRDEFERIYTTETDFIFADPPADPIRITGQNLHYRNFSDPSNNSFTGLVDFTDLGFPIDQADIQSFKLLGPSGEVTGGTVSFARQLYYFKGSTDPNNPYWTPSYFSEYVIAFPAGTDLPAGTYRYEAVTQSGTVLTSQDIIFVGAQTVPLVDAASMASAWLSNGDLKLSWQYPGGIPPAQQRIWIFCDVPGTSSKIFLGLNAPVPAAAGPQEVIIPKRAVESAKILNTVVSPNWQIQLRYTSAGNDNQSARGTSDRAPIAGWK
jgi:hypothetical protein